MSDFVASENINKGPSLEDLHVSIDGLLLTENTEAIILTESIGSPFMEGRIEIRDDNGYLDRNILGNNYINISFKYGGIFQTIIKYVDGARNIDVNNIAHDKKYILDLVSLNNISYMHSYGAFNGAIYLPEFLASIGTYKLSPKKSSKIELITSVALLL